MVIQTLDKSKIANKCQRPGCPGTYVESQGEAVCLTCGRPPVTTLPDSIPQRKPNSEAGQASKPAEKPTETVLATVPPKPQGKGNLAIKRYYDDHRANIELAIKLLGEEKALERWGIADSTWKGIQIRWNTNGDKMAQKVPANVDKPAKSVDKPVDTVKKPVDTVKKTTDSDAKPTKPGDKTIEGLVRELQILGFSVDFGLSHRLPPFPPFSDSWQPDVQLRWMDAFLVLHSDLRNDA